MRLIAGIDDGPGARGGTGHALPHVVSTLAHHKPSLKVLVWCALRGNGDLARTTHQLPGNQERQQLLTQRLERHLPADEVIFVASIGIAQGVCVVLEQVDLPADSPFRQPRLRVHSHLMQGGFARTVISDELVQRIAFRRGDFRV